jgi:hypothetical protein
VIDRAVRLAQSTSATTSAAVLVAFNLIPLAGVLFWGWNVATLLVLYWVENGIIGLINVPKILLAEGPAGTVQIRGRAVSPASRVATAIFFLIHYGLFWFGHGVFVLTLPMFIGSSGAANGAFGGPDFPAMFTLPPGFPADGATAFALEPGAVLRPIGPNLSAVAVAAIGLAISHTVSFVINYLGRHEYRHVSPQQQAQAPYGRLVILHVTIIFGAIVSLFIGSPVGAVIVLVLLKTIVDLRFHLREHGALGAKTGLL